MLTGCSRSGKLCYGCCGGGVISVSLVVCCFVEQYLCDIFADFVDQARDGDRAQPSGGMQGVSAELAEHYPLLDG